MIKIRIILIILLFVPTLSFSRTMLYLPSEVRVDQDHPSAAFPEEIQRYFLISAKSNGNDCHQSQAYQLTLFIYRNVVDNKTVSTYLAKNTDSLCWIDLISYSDTLRPDMRAPGWKIPHAGENTWCGAEGLKNPLLCPLLYNQ